MELQVTNSPFNQEQAELLNRLLPTLTDTQRIWLSGYMTALQGAASAALAAPGASPLMAVAENTATASKEVTVLFGSQTGNSDRLAKKLSKKLEEQGFQVTVSSMSRLQAKQPEESSKSVYCSKHARGRRSAG